MSNSFIGQYLLEKHLITQQQLDHALDVQQTSNIRLGQLSINQGLLNIDQVLYINQQQRLLNKKFGDIAIEQNLLTGDQVEQLLALQVSQRRLLGEILLEESYVDQSTLDEILRAQHENQKTLSNSLSELSRINTLGKNVKEVLNSNEKLFLRCLNSRFKVIRIIDDIHEAENQDNIVGITISHSEHCLCVAMAINDTLMFEIATRFIGIEKNECDKDLAKDAAGELLNCVAGYIITDAFADIITSQYSPTPSSPFFAMTSDELLKSYNDTVAVEFTSDVGSGILIIAQR
jgi:hypothetical protein